MAEIAGLIVLLVFMAWFWFWNKKHQYDWLEGVWKDNNLTAKDIYRWYQEIHADDAVTDLATTDHNATTDTANPQSKASLKRELT